MKPYREIKREFVVDKVISLISSAKEIIVMTMNSDEELKKPLPARYHERLAQIATDGIKITRYTYGSKKTSERIRKKHRYAETIYGGNLNKYQRMIIVDGEKAMYFREDKFLFTRSKPIIKNLLDCVRIYSL